MERETGLEPATSSLGSWHSTTELLPLFSHFQVYGNQFFKVNMQLISYEMSVEGSACWELNVSGQTGRKVILADPGVSGTQ